MLVLSSHWVSGWSVILHHCGRYTLQTWTLIEPKHTVQTVQPWKRNDAYSPWVCKYIPGTGNNQTDSYHLLRTYYVPGSMRDVHYTKQRNYSTIRILHYLWVSLQPSLLNIPVLLNLFRCHYSHINGNHHSECPCPEMKTFFILLAYSKLYPMGILLDHSSEQSWILVVTINLPSYLLSNG